MLISRKCENNLWNIDELLMFLKADIEAKERLFTSDYDANTYNYKEINRSKQQVKPFSAQVLLPTLTVGRILPPRAGNVYSVYGTKDEFENSSCEAFHHCAFS